MEIYANTNLSKDELEKYFHNQSLQAKLLYLTLVETIKESGSPSINYDEFKDYLKPRVEEIPDYFRSLKFLHGAGLISYTKMGV